MRCEAIETEMRPRTAGLACTVCGCTDDRACPGGCYWARRDPPLCSACVEIASEMLDADDIRDGSAGFFGNQDCPASRLPAPHALLWVDGSTGYCTRCREGFTA